MFDRVDRNGKVALKKFSKDIFFAFIRSLLLEKRLSSVLECINSGQQLWRLMLISHAEK